MLGINWFKKWQKERKVRLIATGEASTRVIDPKLPKDDENRFVEEVAYSISFYNNQKDTKRSYKVHGPKFYIEFYWPRHHRYRECELWVNGGLMPTWAKDIVQQKLMR